MLLIFVVCGFRSLRNTSELALHGGLVFTGNAVMADQLLLVRSAKGVLKYQLWEESTGASAPTELYHHLSSVGGAVPSLCSAFLCLSCRGSVPTASRQKERFEQSRKKILLELHRDPSTPAVNQRLPKTDGYAQKDVFATQKAPNSVQLLSLNSLIS